LKSDATKKSYLQSKTLAKLDAIVQSGIIELDALLGGFKAGEITYIYGDSSLISKIPNQLCVNAYQTFNSNTLYVDGGICADPYKIAKYAQMMDVDQNEVLDHVHISRAFTVYQLSTFIDYLLNAELEKHKPKVFVIGKFSTLFLDPDVPVQEAQTILKNIIINLREFTTNYNLITVLTDLDSSIYSNRVKKTVQSYVHETVRMKYIKPCTYVNLRRKQESTMILHIAEGQLCLEHFGMVM
jgi:hypothetical protein